MSRRFSDVRRPRVLLLPAGDDSGWERSHALAASR